MKQTAVQFLIEYMTENFYLTDQSLEQFDIAKEMEKEQNLNSYANGQADTLLMFKQKTTELKAREYNSHLIQELVNETTQEELEKINNEMKQQTAVEWLIEDIRNTLSQNLNKEMQDLCIESALNEAKAIHKEQIIHAYIEASENLDDIIKEAAEQYYNETYNK